MQRCEAFFVVVSAAPSLCLLPWQGDKVADRPDEGFSLFLSFGITSPRFPGMPCFNYFRTILTSRNDLGSDVVPQASTALPSFSFSVVWIWILMSSGGLSSVPGPLNREDS